MVKIIVDYREGKLIRALKKELREGVELEVTSLPLGDVLIGEFIIERKTREDLENSIIDGRLFFQLEELLKEREKVILIVEGEKWEERIRKDALMAALSSFIVRNVSVIFTENVEESAKFLVWLAVKKENHGKEKPLIGKKNKGKEKIAIQLFQTLPGVSVKISKELIRKFKSFKNLANASEKELREVEGIGKKKSRLIVEVLNLDVSKGLEKKV